ncbi:MAG: protein kinase, partial [Novosphingobium sp.]
HRDISPDNILLEGGAIERAKIIDFGIAKDLDPSAATIVGDGFAGKLNYVAPEQLGEFGREIGAWTDVYSLGLTILAVARGRDVDMGGTIVDAVDKRRAGPDLSPVPDGLRPLIARMVMSNPQQRMRSMDEVVQWINDWSHGKQAPAASSKSAKPASEKFDTTLAGIKSKFAGLRVPPLLKEPRGMAMAGGGVLGLLVLVAVVLSFIGGSKDSGDAAGAQQGKVAAATVADPVATTRNVLASGLAKVPCSWIEVEGVDGGNGSPVNVSLKGVSGKATPAIAQIEQMLKGAGVGGVSINYADIAPVPASFCGPIEAFGQFKSGGVGHLSLPQTKFEMSPLDGAWGAQAGKIAAKAIIEINLQGLAGQSAIMAIDEKGQMELLATDMKDLPKELLLDEGNQRYRLTLPTIDTGWSGIVLIDGKGPFNKALFNHAPGTLRPDWPQQFATAAKAQGWKTEMVWYQSVNDQPDAAPSK